MIAPTDPTLKAARARRREAMRRTARMTVSAIVLSAAPKERRALACAYLSAWADAMEAIVGPLAGLSALAAEQGRRSVLISPSETKRQAAEEALAKALRERAA